VKVKDEEDLDAQCVVCCFVPWKYPGVATWVTETTVLVKIISSDQPVFEQQWYETWIPEDAKNPILYSIEAGNDFAEFGMDYQTGNEWNYCLHILFLPFPQRNLQLF
jgi:hypothetical protein